MHNKRQALIKQQQEGDNIIYLIIYTTTPTAQISTVGCISYS